MADERMTVSQEQASLVSPDLSESLIVDLATEAHTGQAGEQTGTAPGKIVEPDGMAEEWKQERLEADSLLRSLHQAHCEDEKHRKWLLRRWPEWLTEGSKDSLPDLERFIPECYLRDGEEDVSESLQSIKNLVKGGLVLLDGEDDKGGQLDVPGMVARLSDEGVVESIPLLLSKLRRTALQSILSALSGRKRGSRNRQWLTETINKNWMTFAGHSEDRDSMVKVQKMLTVVRDPNSFWQEPLPGQLSLEASCPWSAARSALTVTQLEQLPLTCLRVMLEVLLEKPPEVMVGKLPVGGNKERVVTALLEKSGPLLSHEQAGEGLPESLRKSLVVMSVSARYAFGFDGNLIDFLGPLPLETQLLQGNLLSALSYLKTLSFENLQLVHRVMSGAPKFCETRHPGNLRHPIKRVLLDCLLRSEVRSVPEEVKTAAVTIRTLAMKQLEEDEPPVGDGLPVPDSKLNVPPRDDARIDLEIESTLRISSHLLQILYNWKEVLSERSSKEEESHRNFSGTDVVNLNSVHSIGTSDITETTLRISSCNGIRSSTDAIPIGEESLAAHMSDGDIEDMRTRLESDSFDEIAKAPQRGRTNTTTTNTLDDSEDVGVNGNPAEAMENLRLTTIADEAAEVGYALVGSAMERTARSSGVSLKRPIRKYLRSGTIKKVRTGPGEGMNVEQHQLAMILKIAEKIPAISPRVMDNVKRRLGMGDYG